MKIKTISKLLISGIFLNTISSNISLAGMLSTDTRYETFEGDGLVIDDILEEDNIDVEIGGNTLVNFVNYKTGYTQSAVKDNASREVIFDTSTLSSQAEYVDLALFLRPNLEANKTYTLIIDIKENTLASNDFFVVLDSHAQYIPTKGERISSGTLGQLAFTFTAKENNNGLFKMYLRHFLSQPEDSYIKLKDIMIIEGDWSNKKLPNYFEGLKSVNELETDNLEVISSDRKANYFKGSKLFEMGANHPGTGTSVLMTDEEEHYYRATPDVDKTVSLYYRFSKSKDFIPGREYTFSIMLRPERDIEMAIHENRPENYPNTIARHLIKAGEWTTIKTKASNIFNIDALVIFPETVSRGCYLDYKMAKMEMGDTVTEWIPSIEDAEYSTWEGYVKKDIKLNEPLRSVPNGTRDKIVKKNGQWFIERNCGEVILDGSEYWGLSNEYYVSDETLYFATNKIDGKAKHVWSNPSLMSDKFLSGLTIWDADNEGIRIEGDASNSFVLRIRIKKSRLSTENPDGFKDWLSKNPTTVVYELDKPIYEPLDMDFSFPLYVGTTFLNTNSGIPANLKLTIDRVANRARDAIFLAKTSPTVENIKQARMWSNLMKETLLKDDFQDDLDSITEVEDLTLEKKKVSANLDLYIRSENNIAISLDTNQILFDNYTGTSDIEMLQAVDISVNSSLPYDLNAYLPEGIVNGDKTQSIPVNTLNIKDSTDSAYKQFTNTTDKVVLKSGCEAGTGIIHSIDFKLSSNNTHKADVYKSVVKFEVEQK